MDERVEALFADRGRGTALGRLVAATSDDAVAERAEALMDGESDEKAHEKQRAAWRKALA